eukprot:scaffold231853_cov18-Tisochrysis_lutea.AAC.1
MSFQTLLLPALYQPMGQAWMPQQKQLQCSTIHGCGVCPRGQDEDDGCVAIGVRKNFIQGPGRRLCVAWAKVVGHKLQGTHTHVATDKVMPCSHIRPGSTVASSQVHDAAAVCATRLRKFQQK